MNEPAKAIATIAATSHFVKAGVRPMGLTPAVRLSAALTGDRVEPLAQLVDVAGEIVQARQLRKALEPEDPLEHRRRAVLDCAARAVVAPCLGDQPALDQAGHSRIGGDTTNARDFRPRARPEV